METLPKIPTPSLKYKALRAFEIPEIGEDIESVDTMASKLFSQKFLPKKWFFIIAYCVFAGFLITQYFNTPESKEKLENYLFYGFIPFLAVLGYYFYIKNKVLATFYEQFSKSLGFSFKKLGSLEGLDGSLFSIGKHKSVSCDIHGQVGENEVRLCNFQYTIGSGKSSITYKNTIFEINFAQPIAPVLLITDKGRLRPKFLNSKKLTLPEPYENIFDLYVQEKMEIEALQIFDIKFLELMKEKYSQFSLEFTNHKAYIYSNKVISTKTELKNMFTLAKYLAEELEPKLYAMAGSVKAMNELRIK
jgi:hypothetical protein